MSVTTTTRLGIIRWGGGTDPFIRDQLDDSHAALEDRAGIFLKGLLADRPTAGASNERALYLATDQTSSGHPAGTLFYSDGSQWVALDQFAAPVAQTPGDSIAAGTAATYARSDHKHSLPGWGVVGELAQISTAAAAGVATKFARIDHAHTIANNAVTAGKIATGGVSATAQIADGIITTAKLAGGSVTLATLASDQQLQAGMISMWGGATAPTGWLLCNGASVATASYPGLFAIIGYSYGGSGANFTLPDLRGRVPVGAGTGAGLTARTVGQTGGAETVALVLGEMPSHSHTVNSHSHGGATGAQSNDHTHAVGTLAAATTSISHTHTISFYSGNADVPHTHHITDLPSGGQVGDHYHVSGNGGSLVVSGGGPSAGIAAGTGYALASNTSYQIGDHVHYSSGYTDEQTATHNHLISGTSDPTNPAHTHTLSGSTAGVSTGHTHTITAESPGTNSAGSGSAHNNMQPFGVVSFIIKT